MQAKSRPQCCAALYAALPADWRLYTEHKMYEPAFYSTVVQDWGTNYLIARELGPRSFCLVDLGQHAPNANIEMIVARLIQFGKLGGFHFNDAKYGDDDLDTGAIDPCRLFLVFNEFVDAELRGAQGFAPAHMLDQSHNVTDPIESLMVSAGEIRRAYAQALIVDRGALAYHQEANNALMASETLKRAFRTDVEPTLAMARLRARGAPSIRSRPIAPRATARRSRPSGRRARRWAAGSSERLPSTSAAKSPRTSRARRRSNAAKGDGACMDPAGRGSATRAAGANRLGGGVCLVAAAEDRPGAREALARLEPAPGRGRLRHRDRPCAEGGWSDV